MRLDLYTKLVLTVIAACLVWVCVRDVAFVRPAQAKSPQYGTQDVRITGIQIGSVGRYRDELPVSIDAITVNKGAVPVQQK